jgi:hypothetical protein
LTPTWAPEHRSPVQPRHAMHVAHARFGVMLAATLARPALARAAASPVVFASIRPPRRSVVLVPAALSPALWPRPLPLLLLPRLQPPPLPPSMLAFAAPRNRHAGAAAGRQATDPFLNQLRRRRSRPRHANRSGCPCTPHRCRTWLMSATTPTEWLLVLGGASIRPRSLSNVGVAPVDGTLSPATHRPLTQATCSTRTPAPAGPPPGVDRTRTHPSTVAASRLSRSVLLP